jgi:hypothetical protein
MNKLLRGIIASIFLISLSGELQAQAPKHTFTLADSAFLLDGKPFLMISAEMPERSVESPDENGEGNGH